MVHAQVDVRFSLVLLSLMIATELYVPWIDYVHTPSGNDVSTFHWPAI